MNEPLRIIPVILAVAVYGVLISMKIIRIREASRAGQTSIRKLLQFDLARLIIDSVLLTGFLLSPLYPLYFRRFDNTVLGYCTAWIRLITITLLISLIVDWFTCRSEYRERYKGDHPLAHFVINQFVCIFQIYSWLIIIWGIILVLDPTKTNFTEKMILAIALVAICRTGLHVFRKHSKKNNKEEQHEREQRSN